MCIVSLILLIVRQGLFAFFFDGYFFRRFKEEK